MSYIHAVIQALAVVCIVMLTNVQPASAAAESDHSGETFFLAIGVCPPYRKDIPVEACRKSVDYLAKEMTSSFDLKAENVRKVTDEESNGKNVLKILSEYGEILQKDDRLIVYLVIHGDAFHLWADYYQPSPIVQEVNREFLNADEDILVFWTKEEPTIPALALAQKDWLTVDQLADALEAIDARVALLLDSCSSGLFFRTLTRESLKRDNIDYILTAAGSEQISNFDQDLESTLFSKELGDALSLPRVRTFGEAVEHARMTTVLTATALCSSVVMNLSDYQLLFPHLPLPSARTADGKVSPALWFCSQVPTIIDMTGELSGLRVNEARDTN